MPSTSPLPTSLNSSGSASGQKDGSLYSGSTWSAHDSTGCSSRTIRSRGVKISPIAKSIRGSSNTCKIRTLQDAVKGGDCLHLMVRCVVSGEKLVSFTQRPAPAGSSKKTGIDGLQENAGHWRHRSGGFPCFKQCTLIFGIACIRLNMSTRAPFFCTPLWRSGWWER
jgi:hypothetical protein